MDSYLSGIYKYKTRINEDQYIKLPKQLKMDQIYSLGILIQMFLGTVNVYDESDNKIYTANTNYTVLPFKRISRISYELFNGFFDIDIRIKENSEQCNMFLKRDRKNASIYENILNELTQYYLVKDDSPIEGFVHLYRILEFMSYSFPLIYASKSRDYRGSFNSLKKFMLGDTSGELKFFEKFLEVLFEGEMIPEYIFETYIDVSNILESEKFSNQ